MTTMQELLDAPDMLRQAEDHGGGARPVAPPVLRIGQRHSQGGVRAQPVVREEDQRHRRFPGGQLLGEGVRLAGQAVEPIAQHAVEAFLIDHTGTGTAGAPHGARCHAHHAAAATLLDRLGQAQPGRAQQAGPAAAAGALGIPIDAGEQAAVDAAAIADPGHAPPPGRALAGQPHHGRGGRLLSGPAGPGNHEATGAVHAHTAPACAHPRRTGRGPLLNWPTLLCTKDQKASTSTSVSWRSCTKACVSAAAWSPARRSQVPIVSYLWPVISSAAVKLPRRITTSRLRATSAAGVCNRYRGVPTVAPNVRSQPRQRHRCWPRLWPSLTTCCSWQCGQRGLPADGRRAIVVVPSFLRSAPRSCKIRTMKSLHLRTSCTSNRIRCCSWSVIVPLTAGSPCYAAV